MNNASINRQVRMLIDHFTGLGWWIRYLISSTTPCPRRNVPAAHVISPGFGCPTNTHWRPVFPEIQRLARCSRSTGIRIGCSVIRLPRPDHQGQCVQSLPGRRLVTASRQGLFLAASTENAGISQAYRSAPSQQRNLVPLSAAATLAVRCSWLHRVATSAAIACSATGPRNLERIQHRDILHSGNRKSRLVA